MRRILHEVAKLESAEVEFIMEMSMMQKRAKTGLDNRISNPALDDNRAQHFLDSLHAIAVADGSASAEELIEIDAIAAEFGLHSDDEPQSDEPAES
jgi:tellurite resistance protein